MLDGIAINREHMFHKYRTTINCIAQALFVNDVWLAFDIFIDGNMKNDRSNHSIGSTIQEMPIIFIE